MYNIESWFAGMMELADVLDSKSSPGDRVRVQVPLPAPKNPSPFRDLDFFIHCESNGISSRRSRVYHQHGFAVLYLITP